MPIEREESVTLASYRHQGEFDYRVYIEPGHLYSHNTGGVSEALPEEETERPQYFTSLIEDIEISFSYGFVPDFPTTFTSTQVDIAAIIQDASGWQKEVLLKRASMESDYFTIKLPLELDKFDRIIEDIEEELEINQDTEVYVYDLVIEARVAVSTFNGYEWVDDTFVQPMEIHVGRDTLTWDNDLNQIQRWSRWGSYGTMSYKHVGNFSYSISLDPEKAALYGSGVRKLSPEPYSATQIISQGPGEIYFIRLIDVMKSSFSYSFSCDQPVTNLTEEVEITATLEYPDMWQMTFTLVPETEKSGDCIVYFPVDVSYYYWLTEVLREEIGLGAASYDFIINAAVHTMADTQYGPIDEVFTQTLKGTLGTSTVIWDDNLQQSQTGGIGETRTITDPNVTKYRLWTLILQGLSLVAFLFVGWHAVWAKPALSRIEEEATRARKKHKNVIVDVLKLPAGRAGEEVVPIGSLEELVKTADNLLKPVLHHSEADKHTYWVIDGTTRYEYISEL